MSGIIWALLAGFTARLGFSGGMVSHKHLCSFDGMALFENVKWLHLFLGVQVPEPLSVAALKAAVFDRPARCPPDSTGHTGSR